MTQENQGTNEERLADQMEIFGYYKKSFFEDWSPKAVNRIMRRLVDKVTRAYCESLGNLNPKDDYDLRTELRIEHPYREASTRQIYFARAYDPVGNIYARFSHHDPLYSYLTKLEKEFNGDCEKKLVRNAYIIGVIEYKPHSFRRPENMERLKKSFKGPEDIEELDKWLKQQTERHYRQR